MKKSIISYLSGEKKGTTNSNTADAQKRLFIKGLAGVLGSSAASSLLSEPVLAKALAFRRNGQSGKKGIFDEYQMTMLFALVDTILPKTDTPSASELNVHGFINLHLRDCYSEKQSVRIIELLEKVDFIAIQHHQGPFASRAADVCERILLDAEKAAGGFNKAHQSSFKLLKKLVVFGYFTSEVGATQVLKYLGVPGGFKGNISYDSVGTTWGSLAFY